jgi:methylthioribulose-1-phosphate dehydratase
MAKPQRYLAPDPGGEIASFMDLASRLVETGRGFYQRGWVLGTSGNFSAVLSRNPPRLAITSSGVDKGALNTEHILEVDPHGNVLYGRGQPSAETHLHLTLVRLREARAVLHTHSVWSTVLSDRFAEGGGVEIEGYEMLKGLEGVRTHAHREWLPIVENSQNMQELAFSLEEQLIQHPTCHGFLIRRHGLYSWGRSLEEAKRHVEILEFLLEAVGRTRGF